MIAQLKFNKTKYYCSNCRMIQKEVSQCCEFCGANFTNYENVLIQIYKDLIKSDKK